MKERMARSEIKMRKVTFDGNSKKLCVRKKEREERKREIE